MTVPRSIGSGVYSREREDSQQRNFFFVAPHFSVRKGERGGDVQDRQNR